MVSHNRTPGLQYMRMYFQFKANSSSFMGLPGIHDARTAARGSTPIREMRATTPPWILGLWVTQHRTRTPFGFNVKALRVIRFSAPRTPYTQTTLISRIDARNPRSPGALWKHSDAEAINMHAVRDTRHRC